MGYQGDYSGDWRFWSNTEPVTVTITRQNSANPVPAGAATSTIAISDAFRGDISRQGVSSPDLVVSSSKQTWSIPSALLLGAELREGDTITDGSGVVWVIDSAVEETVGTSKLHWTAETTKRKAR